MNTPIRFAQFAIGIVLTFFTVSSVAQITPEETAICNVLMFFDDQMKGTVGLLPVGSSVEVGGFTISDDDSERIVMVEKMLKDSSFNLLMKRIHEETDLTILPIETLKSKIPYFKDGYPYQNGFKKVAKTTDYEQFVRIEIQVTTWATSSSTDTETIGGVFGDPVVSETKYLAVKPMVTIFLRFGDSSGKKTATMKGVYKSKDYIRSQETKLSSYGLGVIEGEMESLEYYKLYNRALSDLISKF